MSIHDITHRPSTVDVLHAVAEHLQGHHLPDRINLTVSYGLPKILVVLPEPTPIAAIIAWAKSLGAVEVRVEHGPEHFHLTATGTLSTGMFAAATVVTDNAETRVLFNAKTLPAVLALDELAAFVRLPKVDA